MVTFIPIATLPVKAEDLEAALHSVCDQGRWQDEVQLVLYKDRNEWRLELAADDGD